jgi:hypothetical protein
LKILIFSSTANTGESFSVFFMVLSFRLPGLHLAQRLRFSRTIHVSSALLTTAILFQCHRRLPLQCQSNMSDIDEGVAFALPATFQLANFPAFFGTGPAADADIDPDVENDLDSSNFNAGPLLQTILSAMKSTAYSIRNHVPALAELNWQQIAWGGAGAMVGSSLRRRLQDSSFFFAWTSVYLGLKVGHSWSITRR